jgi:hypothetical protein
MFEPSAEKDKILMNVIDYFTEKWNEKKSDGKCGELKQFRYKNIEFENKTLNGFKKGKDPKEFEYLDYRNTKSQKVRMEITKKGKVEFIYNKRKLSEFVNLINMFHCDKKKVELLKEHVYFNYEFMTSIAELREMSFVVSMHETILKLKDKELIDISQIYFDQFPFIEQDPNKLIFNVSSRFESRKDNVRQFLTANNLLLLHSYKIKNIERVLFFPEKDYRIEYFWIIKDTPYLLIMTCRKDGHRSTKIHLISSKTKQHLGTIDCVINSTLYRNIEIIINTESLQDLNKIFQLNGKVYFFEDKTFFSITFQNEISIIHTFDTNIQEFFVLDANIFAFRFVHTIVLFKINIDNKATIKSSTIDLFLESTKPKRFVHSATHLPIRNFKMITWDFYKKMIKILQYNNNSQELESFCEFEILFDISFLSDKSFIIDESCQIDNIESHNDQHEMIRFAIKTTKDILKVIEAKKNNEYSIVAEFKDNFRQLRDVEVKFLFENIITIKECDYMNNNGLYGVACINDIGKFYKMF